MQIPPLLLQTINTLVIDDSSMYRASAREMLIKLGFSATHIHFAFDGKQALAACKETPFDLVLCDYNLGIEPDGYDLLDQLKHESLLSPSCVLVVITGDGSAEVVRGFSELEPDGYLLKPISYDILKERLPKLIVKKSKLKPVLNLIESKDYDRAIEEADSIAFDGGEIGYNVQLLKAKAHMLKGELDLARNLLVSLKTPSKPSSMQLELAELAIQQRNYGLCEFLLESFSGSKKAKALDLKAHLTFIKSEFTESIAFIEQAISISPKSVNRYSQQTYCHMAQFELDEAIRSQKKLLNRAKGSFRYDIEMVQLGASLYLDSLASQNESTNVKSTNELSYWLGLWRENFSRASYQYFELLIVARAHSIQSNMHKATVVYQKYLELQNQREEELSLIEQVERVKLTLLLEGDSGFLPQYEALKVTLREQKDTDTKTAALLIYMAKWTSETSAALNRFEQKMAQSKQHYALKEYEEAVISAVEAMEHCPIGNVDGSTHTLWCLSKAWPLGKSKKEVMVIFNTHRDAVLGCDFAQTYEYNQLMRKLINQFSL